MFRVFCVLSVIAMGQIEAKTKQISYGVEEYENQSLDSLSAFGTVRLDKSKVRDLLEVSGHLKAEGCEIGKLKLKGHGILDSCIVKRKSLVQGSLDASRCNFLETLTVASDHIILDSCTLTSITISESGKEEIVELKGNTKVTGTIKFASGQGIVIKDATTDFSGELVGGVLKS